MTEIELFLTGGGFAMATWTMNFIFGMGKAAASETTDF
jgi:hypothetical protein